MSGDESVRYTDESSKKPSEMQDKEERPEGESYDDYKARRDAMRKGPNTFSCPTDCDAQYTELIKGGI